MAGLKIVLARNQLIKLPKHSWHGVYNTVRFRMRQAWWTNGWKYTTWNFNGSKAHIWKRRLHRSD